MDMDRTRFSNAIKTACEQYGLEAHSLQLFVDQGIKPGGFLTAVLENNFMEAAGRADGYNQLHLHDWAMVIYNDTPSGCHGSPEKVAAWFRAGGLVGMSCATLVQS